MSLDFYTDTEEQQRLLAFLYDAIPAAERARLETTKDCHTDPETGGYVYIAVDRSSVVASYNNTRRSEAEIVEWFENAKALAEAN